MDEQMRPRSPKHAPDPSDAYERSHPDHEAGMGRLDNNKTIPQPQPDGAPSAVSNIHKPDRQLNAEDTDEIEEEDLPHQKRKNRKR
jgi:hypothetical protein